MKKLRKLQERLKKFIRKLFWKVVPAWIIADGGAVPTSTTDGTGCAVHDINTGKNLKIINVLDPNIIKEYFSTSEGKKKVINILERNPGLVNTLRGSR